MADTTGTMESPERDQPAATNGRKRGPFARIGLFLRQVMAELRKVVYPKRDQLLSYTAVVLVFVCLIIAIVSVLDLAFGWAVFQVFG